MLRKIIRTKKKSRERRIKKSSCEEGSSAMQVIIGRVWREDYKKLPESGDTRVSSGIFYEWFLAFGPTARHKFCSVL